MLWVNMCLVYVLILLLVCHVHLTMQASKQCNIHILAFCMYMYIVIRFSFILKPILVNYISGFADFALDSNDMIVILFDKTKNLLLLQFSSTNVW